MDLTPAPNSIAQVAPSIQPCRRPLSKSITTLPDSVRLLNLTRQPVPDEFGIGYLGGDSIAGDFIQDNLDIADITINNITLGLGENYSSFAVQQGELMTVFEGVLGIGLPRYNEYELSDIGVWFAAPSLLETMQEQAVIASRAFSLCLNSTNSSTSSIIFDGIDTLTYHGDFVTVPILPAPQLNKTHQDWAAEIDGVSLVGEDGAIQREAMNLLALSIIDSGTGIWYIPPAIADAIADSVGVINNSEYGWLVPCALSHWSLNVTFTFGNSSNPAMLIPVSSFVVPILPPTPPVSFSERRCAFGVYIQLAQQMMLVMQFQ